MNSCWQHSRSALRLIDQERALATHEWLGVVENAHTDIFEAEVSVGLFGVHHLRDWHKDCRCLVGENVTAFR